jgi:hypothetical protein
MDSDIEKLKIFLYPFSWKNPLIYIVLFGAMLFYIYLFFIHYTDETFGLMERSKEMKIFIMFFFITLLFFIFRSAHFVRRIESIFLRSILLLGSIFLVMIFFLPAWIFNKYDQKKMDTYMRILPFRNSPYIRIKPTLVFRDIKTLASSPGNDTGALRFVLNNGQKQSLDIANVSSKAGDIFLVNLYEECSWLQDDIEKQFGPIEKKRMNIAGYNKHFDLFHALWNSFFIWIIFMYVTCLIIYTFKIKVTLG